MIGMERTCHTEGKNNHQHHRTRGTISRWMGPLNEGTYVVLREQVLGESSAHSDASLNRGGAEMGLSILSSGRRHRGAEFSHSTNTTQHQLDSLDTQTNFSHVVHSTNTSAGPFVAKQTPDSTQHRHSPYNLPPNTTESLTSDHLLNLPIVSNQLSTSSHSPPHTTHSPTQTISLTHTHTAHTHTHNSPPKPAKATQKLAPSKNPAGRHNHKKLTRNW
jgi:hypothetical protein